MVDGKRTFVICDCASIENPRHDTEKDGMHLAPKNQTIGKPLLIDGITRSGKFLLAKIVSSFDKVEHFQYVSAFEHLAYLNYSDKISTDVAVSLLQTYYNEHAYNHQVGRNLNTRISDASSIYHSLKLETYTRRSLSEELTPVYNNYFPFIVHEAFCNYDLLFKAFPKLKIIKINRHPIDLVYSWWKKGLGQRWTSDVNVFQPIFQVNDNLVPWFAATWADAYNELGEIDRIIQSIVWLYGKEREWVKPIEPLLELQYEDILSSPWKGCVHKLVAFLNVEASSNQDIVLAKENLPNFTYINDRQDKLKEIKESASPTYLSALLDLSKQYEKG